MDMPFSWQIFTNSEVFSTFSVIDELSRVSGVEIPKAVEEIRNAQIRHNLECDVQDMKKTVAKILGI
jgi:threonine synthase